ncbi:MAG TPA: succinylglutamate desuccinylase/aspartoacylase family protein [Candidatus Aminicenantes bacterium]|nr:succinylglutamate desuccinylase/aspartoacylase family protein [Candidatus Aminicenantes bacterium]
MIRKAAIAGLGAVLAVLAGASFHRGRHLAEPLVAGPGVARVATLGDYFAPLKGGVNDAHVYILEGQAPGGTVLLLGGTHPEEPAGRLAAWIFAERAELGQGRLLVVPTANRSASTVTRLGGAYPPDFTVPTAWGGQKFRMGDRWSNPLDQWPDPEVYLHYPSRQQLAYVDIRNLNRAFPGRPGGTLTERTCYAIMELVRREKVDIAIDFHEAELQYPVISAIVAHERGADLAAAASMFTSSFEGFSIGVENSPKALRGLSHREIGDASGAISLLLEAPEPFLDATRGRTDRALLLTGRDEFVVRAGRRGLLFEKIDENGWPIDVRVGRHTSTVLQILENWTADRPDRGVVVAGVPRYAEVVEKGVGAFLTDPKTAPPGRLFRE